MKGRRRGSGPHPREVSFFSMSDYSPKRSSFEQEPEVGTSLVNTAAPMAGSNNEYHQAADPVVDGLEEKSRSRYLARDRRPGRQSWASLNGLGRERGSQTDLDHQHCAPFTSSTLSLQSDAASTAQSLPNATSHATPMDMVQQSQPANSSKCPLQIQKKSQDRERPHNSSDPRPRRLASKLATVDRGSVSTISSHPSSGFPSRFSFGLLLSPSLELFKFKNISTSLGGRGSGWSDWFKKEGLSTEKAGEV